MNELEASAVGMGVSKISTRRPEPEQIRIVVDITFATPYCQRPLEFGVDLVVHSLTKDIGGFGTDMGGAVIGSNRFYNLLMLYRKDFGGGIFAQKCLAVPVYGLPTPAARQGQLQKGA